MELINSIREQKSKLVTPSSNIYRINTHLDPKPVSYTHLAFLLDFSDYDNNLGLIPAYIPAEVDGKPGNV